MAQPGLGKNSPVVLSLGKANYEALIERHGQWVRWRTARKCACMTETGQPNVHCEKCGGTGDIYGYQKFYNDTLQVKVRDNIFELPEDYTGGEVLKVYDTKGSNFSYRKTGQFVEITGGTRPLSQNEILEALVKNSAVKRLETASLEKTGSGYYRVPGIESPARKLDGVYYRAPGDVIAVEKVMNPAGEEIAVSGCRQNMIQVESDADDLTAYGVEYILPFKFLVLSQELNKADAQMMNAHNGDAVCTFPYMFDVAENDVLTVLSGTMTAKAVINKRGGAADDILPEYFVQAVQSLETKETAYREGTDFILTGTNRIHWLGENRPEAGAVMSLVYQYLPTYRVAMNIPNLRTSEDQRIPRKAVLKLNAAWQESKRINQNG
jgi:ATP-dependent Clp protease adapter protein ClpS